MAVIGRGSAASWRDDPGSAGRNFSMAGPTANRVAGANSGDTGWHPTVSSLVVLIAFEIAAYCLLRWAFRTAHGG
jgi:hypothetical protein